MSFRYRTVEHQFEVVDRGSTTFRSEHKFDLEALQPSRFFIRNWFWTGSGAEKEPIPEVLCEIDKWGFPKHRIHGPLVIQNRNRIVVVDLGRTLAVGETDVLHFRHKMKDLEGSFEPRFQISPTAEISERIVIRLVLPDWKGLRVEFKKFSMVTKDVLATSASTATRSMAGRVNFEEVVDGLADRDVGYRYEWRHDDH
ncbi:hypothetical protein CO662_20665 [Rhizobium anhuiense]|uniref:Uncharacterized protein n=1 Tax=Rhizobium anhuiense TaxID=1184720 RepID=A0ABX4J424_9HYPH|nr:hypothetical protein [Rhizobium anhuiense]PDS43174.1 hypothetical protein CO668_18880 [Rhizobium anhuiense]PDS49915.1 hypothetical protein CO662_20665 [Rhizobium anhuiense]